MSSLMLASSQLGDLVNIFAFLEEHHFSFKDGDTKENLTLRDERLTLARACELGQDSEGGRLVEAQETCVGIFTCPKTLLGSERDFWRRFRSGTSPKRLLRHPAVWSIDRAKCFILDIADARFDLQIEGPNSRVSQEDVSKSPLESSNDPFEALPNWIGFMETEESGLKNIIASQKAYYANVKKKAFPFMGGTLTELVISLSNIVSQFHSLFRLDMSTKTRKEEKAIPR